MTGASLGDDFTSLLRAAPLEGGSPRLPRWAKHAGLSRWLILALLFRRLAVLQRKHGRNTANQTV